MAFQLSRRQLLHAGIEGHRHGPGSVDDTVFQLHALVKQVGMATIQVSQAGTPAQVQQASKILGDTRKALYRILAADDDTTGEDTEE